MKKIIALGFVLSAPLITLAATGTIDGIISQLIMWVGWIVPALITLAIGYFIWGVIQFISASDEEAKKMGRTKIVNGLIGLFVIMAFWGIIAVVKRTFGIESYGGAGQDVITQPLLELESGR
jgi:hypothetical protein